VRFTGGIVWSVANLSAKCARPLQSRVLSQRIVTQWLDVELLQHGALPQNREVMIANEISSHSQQSKASQTGRSHMSRSCGSAKEQFKLIFYPGNLPYFRYNMLYTLRTNAALSFKSQVVMVAGSRNQLCKFVSSASASHSSENLAAVQIRRVI
jgi:hypothetical protein